MTLMSILKDGFDPLAAAQMKEKYQNEHHLHLKGFFDSFLAEHFRRQLNMSDISEFYKSQVGDEFTAMDYSFNPQFIKEYNYLINQKNYLEFLTAVTGHEIGCMQGHVYVSDGSKKRGYGYHSDNDGNRHFLVSINISEDIFEGGLFKMRESDSKKVLFEVRNTDPGGALIARIGDNFEHTVRDVTGEARRIALLSWALVEPRGRRFNLFA